MVAIIWVGAGGALGSVARYLCSLVFPYTGAGFPYTTFVINVLACLLLGMLAGANGNSPQRRWALEVGFCGGFSTFSTFSKETFSLIQSQQINTAVLYIGLSNIVGLLAFGLGWWITTDK